MRWGDAAQGGDGTRRGRGMPTKRSVFEGGALPWSGRWCMEENNKVQKQQGTETVSLSLKFFFTFFFFFLLSHANLYNMPIVRHMILHSPLSGPSAYTGTACSLT